ncbi:MAG: tetratricopeptide repeat-containing sensor histidine kinase [Aurantibacter sp.]
MWVFIFLISAQCAAQFVPAKFKRTIDSLIEAAPKTYVEIDLTVKPFRRDTILMHYFAQTASKRNYLDGQAYALIQLGTYFRNTSQYSRALALHQRALEVATESNNLEFEVSSLNQLGVDYRRTSAIRTAMDYNQRALELAETAENPSEGLKRNINVSLNSIGNLYQTLKQYDLAIENYERSIIVDTDLGNKLGLAINHQNIGECLEEQGQLDGALRKYRISLTYNEEIGNNMGRVICKNSIAQIYIKQNKPEEAINLLEPVLATAEQLGDGFLISPVHINLGWAQLLAKRYEEAEKNMLHGLEVAEKFDLKESSARASHLISELFETTGNYKKALLYSKKAEKLDEQILDESTVRYVNDVIFRYDAEKKSNEIAVLAKENELVRMEVKKTRTVLLISGIALALLAGIFYILYRQYQLNNEKKLLTLEQSMLRSQMNPHFLFNSLNSIKLYIINNEQKNAVHYLNKFSKLVRKILEASSLKEIPLDEELETVELYMNIENIRFSNEINFKTTVAEDVDTHAVKIPSLILQPFLENALWHGLSSKVGEKNIDLDISRTENDYIHIAIMDNGIGREAAEKIKQGKVLKRKSVGINITKERLANFSRDYQNSFNVEMVDLYDDKGIASGTRVILDIPTV